jgi:hypothetical protein
MSTTKVGEVHGNLPNFLGNGVVQQKIIVRKNTNVSDFFNYEIFHV